MTLKATLQRCSCTLPVLSCIIATLAIPGPAQALTIVRNFVGGEPAPNLAGGGNLEDIFNVAADYWEAAIADDHTLTLDYAWAPRSGNTLATYSSRGRQFSEPFRHTRGLIRFDNDGTSPWFADPTPQDSSEYQNFSTNTFDYGGGEMNVTRRWSAATGDAIGRYDLFTVALHEIGHGMNLLTSNPAYRREVQPDQDIDITIDPFSGSSLPMTSRGGGHLNMPNAVMQPLIFLNQRRLLTEADILAAAQLSQFRELDLDPSLTPMPPGPPSESIPEGNLLFALFGAAGIWSLGRRRRLSVDSPDAAHVSQG